MRISATGMHNSRVIAGRVPHPASNGFTLIELLVVIVIIGIMVSVASLSMGVLGRDTEIEHEAKRLEAVITQIREEAELQGKDIGVLLERDGYRFMRRDYTQNRWQELAGDDLTNAHRFPDGLTLRLWLEGREVVLKTHEQNQGLLTMTSSSSSASSGITTPFTTQANSTLQSSVVPQLALLSSGDISPFTLRIERDNNAFAWVLTGKTDNTLTLESTDQGA